MAKREQSAAKFRARSPLATVQFGFLINYSCSVPLALCSCLPIARRRASQTTTQPANQTMRHCWSEHTVPNQRLASFCTSFLLSEPCPPFRSTVPLPAAHSQALHLKIGRLALCLRSPSAGPLSLPRPLRSLSYPNLDLGSLSVPCRAPWCCDAHFAAIRRRPFSSPAASSAAAQRRRSIHQPDLSSMTEHRWLIRWPSFS